MKQLYYGNDYYHGGYKVLACSNGIPNDVVSHMIAYAEGITETTGGEYGLVMKGNEAILFCNSKVAPRSEVGEQRGTYFSHQYYISGRESSDFFRNLPYMLESLFFTKEYGDFYDTSEVTIPHSSDGQGSGTRLGEIFREAVGKGCTVIAYGSGIDREKVKRIVCETARGLSVNERKGLSFVCCGNAKDRRLTDANIIFCDENIFSDLQASLYKKCIYFNIDTNEARYSADMNVGKPEQDRNGGDIMNNHGNNEGGAYTQEYGRREPWEGGNHTPRSQPQKSPLVGFLGLFSLVLSIIAILFSIILSGYSIIRNERYQQQSQAIVDMLSERVAQLEMALNNQGNATAPNTESESVPPSGLQGADAEIQTKLDGLEVRIKDLEAKVKINTQEVEILNVYERLKRMDDRLDNIEDELENKHGVDIELPDFESEADITTQIQVIEQQIKKLEEAGNSLGTI